MKRWICRGLLFAAGLVLSILLVSLATTALRESKTPAEAAPASGKFIQTRDARLYVREEGPVDGRHILLIHGTGAWGEIWRETIDALTAEHFNVLTVDIPPFGFSQKLTGADSYAVGKQADRLLDALRALDIQSTIIVCHSVGCRPALETALKRPGIAEKLVLADPALGFAADRSRPQFEQKNPGGLAKAFLSAGLLRDAVTGIYGTNPLSIKPLFSSFVSNKAAVTDRRLGMLKQPLAVQGMTRAQGDWLQDLVASPEHGLFTDFRSFAKLKMPILIIWGREDTITPLWQGEALPALFGNARLTVIPDCGHIPYIEQTPAFNQRLLGFIKGG